MEHLAPAWTAMGESLLIGLIVGIERESDKEERHAGLRDFVSIGLAGGLCGVLHQPWIAAAALAALTAMLVVFRVQTPHRTGITTEIAAVVTFLLCVLTATPEIEYGSSLAIALTVVLALFLDARETLRRFAREKLSDQEYWDTLRFLAVIFVILPVLPDQNLGPFGFFNPRRTWIFVILVCSINFIGYFLQKFLGGKEGLPLTAALGGIGSTTASTLAFAREAAAQPERVRDWAFAAVLANVVLNPRVAALLWMAGGPLFSAALAILALMTAVGCLFAWWLWRGLESQAEKGKPLQLGNPFRLIPALQFGLLFAGVRLLAHAGAAHSGSTGIAVSSALGGSMDVDAIIFSLAGLMRDGRLAGNAAVLTVLIAMAANAAVKTAMGYTVGGRRFGGIVLLGFSIMFLAAAAYAIALA